MYYYVCTVLCGELVLYYAFAIIEVSVDTQTTEHMLSSRACGVINLDGIKRS